MAGRPPPPPSKACTENRPRRVAGRARRPEDRPHTGNELATAPPPPAPRTAARLRTPPAARARRPARAADAAALRAAAGRRSRSACRSRPQTPRTPWRRRRCRWLGVGARQRVPPLRAAVPAPAPRALPVPKGDAVARPPRVSRSAAAPRVTAVQRRAGATGAARRPGMPRPAAAPVRPALAAGGPAPRPIAQLACRPCRRVAEPAEGETGGRRCRPRAAGARGPVRIRAGRASESRTPAAPAPRPMCRARRHRRRAEKSRRKTAMRTNGDARPADGGRGRWARCAGPPFPRPAPAAPAPRRAPPAAGRPPPTARAARAAPRRRPRRPRRRPRRSRRRPSGEYRPGRARGAPAQRAAAWPRGTRPRPAVAGRPPRPSGAGRRFGMRRGRCTGSRPAAERQALPAGARMRPAQPSRRACTKIEGPPSRSARASSAWSLLRNPVRGVTGCGAPSKREVVGEERLERNVDGGWRRERDGGGQCVQGGGAARQKRPPLAAERQAERELRAGDGRGARHLLQQLVVRQPRDGDARAAGAALGARLLARRGRGAGGHDGRQHVAVNQQRERLFTADRDAVGTEQLEQIRPGGGAATVEGGQRGMGRERRGASRVQQRQAAPQKGEQPLQPWREKRRAPAVGSGNVSVREAGQADRKRLPRHGRRVRLRPAHQRREPVQLRRALQLKQRQQPPHLSQRWYAVGGRSHPRVGRPRRP
eukprot:scaffold20626_cov105-Isochrysis_galbana.AAC.7